MCLHGLGALLVISWLTRSVWGLLAPPVWRFAGLVVIGDVFWMLGWVICCISMICDLTLDVWFAGLLYLIFVDE